MQCMETSSSCCSSENDPKERRRKQNRRNQRRFAGIQQQHYAHTRPGNDQMKSDDPQPGSSPARTMAETTTDVERDTVFLPELELQHPLPSFGGPEESESEPPLPWADWLDGVPAMNTNEHGILTASPDVFGNPIALPQTPATPLSFPQHQPQATGQLPAVPTFQPWPSLMGLGYDAASLAPIPPMASYKVEESVSYRTVNGGQHTISVVESFEAPASYAQSSEKNHNQS